MDKAYEMHLNVNRARIVGETLTYLNNRLNIMKDLSRDEAYYVTATAFRTFAFTEQDWNALKEKDEFFPKFLKDVKGLPYKSAIKKISDELYDRSNPNREKEEAAKKEAERKEKEKAEKESIFEEDEQDPHNARAGTSHAGDISNARMNGGKPITFHIPQDPQVEDRVLNLVHLGRIDEAHTEIHGFISECLEGQLSQEDFIKANQPGDKKINKPVQMNSIGISQTLHIRNKSLIDALTCAHLGLVLTKKLELDKKLQDKKMQEHKRHHFEHAMDELIINEDVKAAGDALQMTEEDCKAAVEEELCDVCDHLDVNHEKEALETVKKTDKLRSNYYEFFTNKRWGDQLNYDLCINSAIGAEKCAEIIINYIKTVKE